MFPFRRKSNKNVSNDSAINEGEGSHKRSRGLALRREGESGFCNVLPDSEDSLSRGTGVIDLHKLETRQHESIENETEISSLKSFFTSIKSAITNSNSSANKSYLEEKNSGDEYNNMGRSHKSLENCSRTGFLTKGFGSPLLEEDGKHLSPHGSNQMEYDLSVPLLSSSLTPASLLSTSLTATDTNDRKIQYDDDYDDDDDENIEVVSEYLSEESSHSHGLDLDTLMDRPRTSPIKRRVPLEKKILITNKKTYSVVFSVIEKFIIRDDLNVLDWIKHAQEEHMDAILYLEKLKQIFEKDEL